MLLRITLAALFCLSTATGFCQERYRSTADNYQPDKDRPKQYPLDQNGFIFEPPHDDSDLDESEFATDLEIAVDHFQERHSPGRASDQSSGVTDWNIDSVMRQIDNEASTVDPGVESELVWWTPHVIQPVDSGAQPIQVNVGDLILMALEHSAKVNVARALPQIRETAITGAEAAFDWSKYIDARWVDTSDPVGSALTVGGAGNRFREHNFAIDAGFRRKFFNGADFYTYHRFGHVNSNSTFFVPNDQATSRIVLGFTQPLMRGRGEVYNTSLILLAQLDTGSASDEFHRQLQSHLLEVARGYWALYLERTNLAQKVSLFLKTQEIANQLNSRSNIDAQQTQVISAKAALESRKSELIRARAAVKNAETRLRALINSPMLSDSNMIEMIPAEHPSTMAYPAENHVEFETAIQNRPEIAAALKAIRAGCIRLNMSDHEILPSLNLVTEAYVSGLRGESDIGNAWVDQFREGEPSYSVGLQYEVPIGRRAAFSNLQRRQVEVRQLQEQYRSTLELIRAEVEVAVRELKTSYQELHAKHRGLKAAQAEADTLAARWEELGNQGGTGGLLLESLLRAQERVTQFEFEFAKAQMTYSLALINLRHANGTLYQTHGGGGQFAQPQSMPIHEASPQQWEHQPPASIDSNEVPNGQPGRGILVPEQTPKKKPPKKKIIQHQPQRRHPFQQQQQQTANRQYQQVNDSWRSDPRYQPRVPRPQMPPQNHPANTRTANSGNGLSYGEMIGKPESSSNETRKDDWRNLLR